MHLVKKVNHQIKFIIEILIIVLGKKILTKIVYVPKKQFVKEIGENNWKGNYKIINFNLIAEKES